VSDVARAFHCHTAVIDLTVLRRSNRWFRIVVAVLFENAKVVLAARMAAIPVPLALLLSSRSVGDQWQDAAELMVRLLSRLQDSFLASSHPSDALAAHWSIQHDDNCSMQEGCLQIHQVIQYGIITLAVSSPTARGHSMPSII
jgi:hypothetical protein